MKFKQSMIVLTGLLFMAGQSDARFGRINQMPNGGVLRCQNCHMSTRGRDARNDFGLEVEKLVTPGGSEAFWSPELAALDSDGDGFTNGEELGDPEGVWVSGATPAGSSALVSLPGFATDQPPNPLQVAVLNVQLDASAADQDIQVSRAIAGRASDFAWSGSVDEDGSASITISTVGDPKFFRIGANGYYRAQTVDSTGAVLGRWSAFAVRGGKALDVSLPDGGRASVSPLSGTSLAATKPVPAEVTLAGKPYLETPSLSSGILPNGFSITADRMNGVSGGDFVFSVSEGVGVASVLVDGASVDVAELGSDVYGFSASGSFSSVRVELASGSAVDVVVQSILLDANQLPFSEVTLRPDVAGHNGRVVLHQNYPNPFNPTTQIEYELGAATDVRLSVHSVLGQEVDRLVHERQGAGRYTIVWDANGFSSGTYYLHLTTGDKSLVRKMMLVK